jgi:hypothetical protein
MFFFVDHRTIIQIGEATLYVILDGKPWLFWMGIKNRGAFRRAPGADEDEIRMPNGSSSNGFNMVSRFWPIMKMSEMKVNG